MTPQIGAAIPLEDILEKDWQHDVLALAKQLGWVVYHTFNSQRSAHGFPDACLVRENDRHLFIEFKRERTKLTDDQKRWLRLLMSGGAECYVARPRDLELVGAILASRPFTSHGETEAAARLRLQTAEEIAA